MSNEYRTEKDFLGEVSVPAQALYGIHAARAQENFSISRFPVPPALIHAYGTVKQACLETIAELGYFADKPKEAIEAMIHACGQLAQGSLDEHIITDALQGGAGTSLNMNVNEVIANRTLELLGQEKGQYNQVSPLDDINRFQSTNDTYPTALKLAAIQLIANLEQQVVSLQEAFQEKEKAFAHVVKIGRTQYQDAVLTTLGREMSAYAEAMNRDRWRIYKCTERLRVIHLGGTAIGTGLGAPREYIFAITEKLREMTGIGFARAENLVESTQNADVFVEVSGILKAHASSLLKICTDLRLLSSGPDGGLSEITLPAVQPGSSIMPGKVNPVIPEAVSQAAMLAMGHDQVICQACSAGSLELNAFLPLVAHCLLHSIESLTGACEILRAKCVQGIEANEDQCRQRLEGSTSLVTALLPALGYEKACAVAMAAKKNQRTVRQEVLEQKLLTEDQFNALITPQAVTRLGSDVQIPGSGTEGTS